MSREWRETLGYLANVAACAVCAWFLWPSPYAMALAASGGFVLGLCAAMWAVWYVERGL